MKKLIIMAATVAVSLSSCSKNEVFLNESAENAVSFSTYTGVAVKGAVLAQTDLQTDGFGVLAYDQGENAAFADQKPNYMYNTKVYQKSSAWVCDITKYWSTSTTNYYSFFAYAPYESYPAAGTDQGIILSADSDTGAPTITFTLQDDADDMVDLVAGQKMNINKYGNVYGETVIGSSVATVDLNFKHQLTRATFKAVSGFTTPETFVNIKSFRILGTSPTLQVATSTGTIAGKSYNSKYGSTALYKSAIYTFDTETTNNTNTNHDQDGTWAYKLSTGNDGFVKITEGYDLKDILATSSADIAYGGTTSSYATEGVRLAGDNTTAVSLFNTDEYIFLIPPYRTDGIDDTNNTIQVELVYDIVTVDAGLTSAGYYAVTSANNFAIVNLTAGTLAQGYAYEYIFTISGSATVDPTTDTTGSAKDAVTISGTMIDWHEASGSNEISVL